MIPQCIPVSWQTRRGYSIASQLASDGLSFEAFDIIRKSAGPRASNSVRKKIVSRLAKSLRADFLENDAEEGIDIGKIVSGVYVISIGTGFEIKYSKSNSGVIYIGSGGVYGRIKTHLTGKLFDFAEALGTVPLRFHISDLSHLDDSKLVCRSLEQALLEEFRDKVDPDFPLLNKNSATLQASPVAFEKGWNAPLRKPSKSTTSWLLMPKDTRSFKGALI